MRRIALLLGAGGKRPRGCRAAENTKKCPPLHVLPQAQETDIVLVQAASEEGAIDVRFGSKCEEPALSICRPVYP